MHEIFGIIKDTKFSTVLILSTWHVNILPLWCVVFVQCIHSKSSKSISILVSTVNVYKCTISNRSSPLIHIECNEMFRIICALSISSCTQNTHSPLSFPFCLHTSENGDDTILNGFYVILINFNGLRPWTKARYIHLRIHWIT